VKKELADNGNPEAVFDYKKIGVFGVTVYDALYKLTVPEDIVHESGETVKLPNGKSSQKILQLVQENSFITTTEMADKLSLTRRAIAKQIEKLKREGKLKRIGPDKGGRWEIPM
jgi:ATP-dependent DNA helicase RecG